LIIAFSSYSFITIINIPVDIIHFLQHNTTVQSCPLSTIKTHRHIYQAYMSIFDSWNFNAKLLKKLTLSVHNVIAAVSTKSLCTYLPNIHINIHTHAHTYTYIHTSAIEFLSSVAPTTSCSRCGSSNDIMI
jgi:hypothetical protein